MKSKITGGATRYLFTAKVLEKYDVKYYQCVETGFIQTEDPYWLDEAYSSAIASLDLGLLMRNENMVKEVTRIISSTFNPDARFLDYAGGYGIFTRLMRDRGFDFYHTDKYCQNIFALQFSLEDTKPKFELLTAFEVFEHLVDPIEELKYLLTYSDNVLFSTELIPMDTELTPSGWWYFVPEIGQHISFYTKESLKVLANKVGCNLYTNGSNLHLITRQELHTNPLSTLKREKFLLRKLKKLVKKIENSPKPRLSLLDHDINLVRSKLIK